MLGYVHLLLLGIPEAVPPGAARQVERIRLAPQHLLSIIEEILTFSRIEAGRETVEAEEVGLPGNAVESSPCRCRWPEGPLRSRTRLPSVSCSCAGSGSQRKQHPGPARTPWQALLAHAPSHPVFTRCIFCHAPFPANRSLEHLRHGRRVAFDPARGRLWTVCGACARWTLAPIEERWEALEELDRLAADRARLLSRTDNIELLRAESEGLELVRVGRAQRAEEAWWRYGRELMGRRRRSYLLQGVEVAAVLGVAFASGGVAAGWYGTGALSAVARWQRFGRVAVRERSVCAGCGAVLEGLRFRDAGKVVLEPGDAPGELSLRVRCPGCPSHAGSGHRLSGTVAEHALRRILAYRHFDGASEGRIRAASMAIDHAGSAEALASRLAGERIPLRALEKDRRTHAVALEIAVNDATERRLLGMELAELERRWKEEEEIAAIVDRELTFLPGLDRLLGRLRGAPEGPPSTP